AAGPGRATGTPRSAGRKGARPRRPARRGRPARTGRELWSRERNTWEHRRGAGRFRAGPSKARERAGEYKCGRTERRGALLRECAARFRRTLALRPGAGKNRPPAGLGVARPARAPAAEKEMFVNGQAPEGPGGG